MAESFFEGFPPLTGEELLIATNPRVPAPSGIATSGVRHSEHDMTATEVWGSRRRQMEEACSMPSFRSAPLYPPRVDLSRYTERLYAVILEHMMVAANPPKMWTMGALGEWSEPAPPARHHPLQKLSSTPNGWGQSMWRPWE